MNYPEDGNADKILFLLRRRIVLFDTIKQFSFIIMYYYNQDIFC